MRIEKATDYGGRKVIRVLINDPDTQWVHPEDDGDAHRANLARGPRQPDGSRGELDPTLVAGTECHACVNNWDVREFQFEGDTLLKPDPTFVPPLIPDPTFEPDPDDPDAEAPLIPDLNAEPPNVLKTDQDLKDEALASALASMPAAARDMGT